MSVQAASLMASMQAVRCWQLTLDSSVIIQMKKRGSNQSRIINSNQASYMVIKPSENAP